MKPATFIIILAITCATGTVIVPWTTPPIIGGKTTAMAKAMEMGKLRNPHAEILSVHRAA